MSGFLMKLKQLSSVRIFSNYTGRYFTLSIKDGLFTYSQKKGGIPRDCINLNSITGIESMRDSFTKPAAPYKHQFTLLTKDRSFTLFAATKEEKKKWVCAITYVLTQKIKQDDYLKKMLNQNIEFDNNQSRCKSSYLAKSS